MNRIRKLLSLGCALALFAMMALTFCDVIARKLLGNSIVGATELTELLMLVTIFFALPLTTLGKEHVSFDLLDALLPRWGRMLQHVGANLMGCALLLGAAWLVEVRALRTVEEGDHTAQLGVALGPLHHLMAALLLLTALVHLYLLMTKPERDHD